MATLHFLSVVVGSILALALILIMIIEWARPASWVQGCLKALPFGLAASALIWVCFFR